MVRSCASDHAVALGCGSIRTLEHMARIARTVSATASRYAEAVEKHLAIGFAGEYRLRDDRSNGRDCESEQPVRGRHPRGCRPGRLFPADPRNPDNTVRTTRSVIDTRAF